MKSVLIAAVAAFAVAAPLAVHADPGKSKGHGKGESTRAATAGPPGLAKKPYGMPPGQAKKMYGRGDKLPASYMASKYQVANPAQYQLSAAPAGSRWVKVDDQYYLAQTKTGAISRVVAALAQ